MEEPSKSSLFVGDVAEHRQRPEPIDIGSAAAEIAEDGRSKGNKTDDFRSNRAR
jgi:hypothetical protein